MRLVKGRWSCVAQCQCATSLFQAFRRNLGYRLARIVEAGIQVVSAHLYTACHYNEVHSDDVYNIHVMIINCQIHTVCLGIVTSIIVPSFSLWQHTHELRGHLCFCFFFFFLVTLFSAACCISLFTELTLVIFIFLLHVFIPRFVHPADNSISCHW